jgi:GntR family transcriptional regulator, phosphonate transport system regulatory protein
MARTTARGRAKTAGSRIARRDNWKAIAADLRAAIEGGKLSSGARMPTEPELMQSFDSSRYAVRRALTALQNDGLVRVEQGRGTFVHDGFLVSYRLGDRPRFTNVLLENQITPGQEILRIDRVPGEGEVAKALGTRAGAPVLLMELLGYANGQVVKHDINYFPLPRFEEFEARLRQSGSVTEALQQFGIPDYRRRSTSIIGRLPEPAEARLLRQLRAQPIFECLRVDVDAGGAPILFGRTIFSCERVRLILPADESQR